MQTDLQKNQGAIAQDRLFSDGRGKPRGAIDECRIGRMLACAADEGLPTDKMRVCFLWRSFICPRPLMCRRSWTASSCLRSLSRRISSVNLMRRRTAFFYFAPCARNRLIAASRRCRRAIGEYRGEGRLVIKEFVNPRSRIKPFTLQSKFAAGDVANRAAESRMPRSCMKF